MDMLAEAAGLLVKSLDKTCTRYKMETSADKTKLLTVSMTSRGRSRLGTVACSTHLRASDFLRLWLKTEGTIKKGTGHCSFEKAEANVERHIVWISGETDLFHIISIYLYAFELSPLQHSERKEGRPLRRDATEGY